MTKRRRQHTWEQIVEKLRDAEAMLNASRVLVRQTLEVIEVTYRRWRNPYGIDTLNYSTF